MTRFTLLKEHSDKQHIRETVYFQRRTEENTWRRVQGKTQLCLFYPPPSNWLVGTQHSLYYLVFVLV